MKNLDQLYAEIIETAIRAVCTGYTHQMVLDRFPFLSKDEALRVHEMLTATECTKEQTAYSGLKYSEVRAWTAAR